MVVPNTLWSELFNDSILGTSIAPNLTSGIGICNIISLLSFFVCLNRRSSPSLLFELSCPASFVKVEYSQAFFWISTFVTTDQS